MRVLIALVLSFVFALPMMAAGYSGDNPAGLTPLDGPNTMPGMNAAGTALEYKSITSTDGIVTITHSAGNIDLKAGLTTYAATVSATLTAASTSNQLYSGASGNATLALPLASTCPGKRLTFFNLSAGAGFILNRSGSDTIGGLSSTTMSIVRSFEPVTIISDGISRWHTEVPRLGTNMLRSSASPGNLLQPLPAQNNTSTPLSLSTSSANLLILDTNGGAQTITLPDTSSVEQSRIQVLKRRGSNTATINRAGSDTIRYKDSDSLTSITLPNDGSFIVLVCTGAGTLWSVLGGSDNVLSQFGGSNSIAFTGTTAAMVAGTVTITDARVKTGDIIQATRVSGAGVSAGITSYSIVNNTSFTLNGVVTDDGVYSYQVIRP